MIVDAISPAQTDFAKLERPDRNKDLTTHLGRTIRAIGKNDYSAARSHYLDAKEALTPSAATTAADKSILSAFYRMGEAFDTDDNKKISDAFIAMLQAAAGRRFLRCSAARSALCERNPADHASHAPIAHQRAGRSQRKFDADCIDLK